MGTFAVTCHHTNRWVLGEAAQALADEPVQFRFEIIHLSTGDLG